MNKVQKTASELIQADARFVYTLIDISKNAPNITSNYICMSLPYIGLFTEGTEQWYKKVSLNAPSFNETEKEFYKELRQGHKLFGNSYKDYSKLLLEKLRETENYFYNIRSLRERILGYYNVGVDLCNSEFCGNTVLCLMYISINVLGFEDIGKWLQDVSKVTGELVGFSINNELPIYRYNDDIIVSYKDYHFYKKSPLKINNDFGFLLFSVLCSVNYVIEFIENYFIDEIPQKFKYAYLQYYYLCDFIKEINNKKNTDFYIDDCLYDRRFRNCLAHYGLGQYISEDEIISDDILKGLTNKAFGKDYLTTKSELYDILRSFTNQIKQVILK